VTDNLEIVRFVSFPTRAKALEAATRSDEALP
jgi:hypothetical protein